MSDICARFALVNPFSVPRPGDALWCLHDLRQGRAQAPRVRWAARIGCPNQSVSGWASVRLKRELSASQTWLQTQTQGLNSLIGDECCSDLHLLNWGNYLNMDGEHGCCFSTSRKPCYLLREPRTRRYWQGWAFGEQRNRWRVRLLMLSCFG